MNLEARLTQKFVDLVLSKIINLSKYDSDHKLANLHYKRSKIILMAAGMTWMIFSFLENKTLNLILVLLGLFIALSCIAFQRILFQKNVLDMSERQKERYALQVKNSDVFTVLFFSPILIVVIYIVSILHKSGIL